MNNCEIHIARNNKQQAQPLLSESVNQCGASEGRFHGHHVHCALPESARSNVGNKTQLVSEWLLTMVIQSVQLGYRLFVGYNHAYKFVNGSMNRTETL